jgi:periplasmic protein TonB
MDALAVRCAAPSRRAPRPPLRARQRSRAGWAATIASLLVHAIALGSAAAIHVAATSGSRPADSPPRALPMGDGVAIAWVRPEAAARDDVASALDAPPLVALEDEPGEPLAVEIADPVETPGPIAGEDEGDDRDLEESVVPAAPSPFELRDRIGSRRVGLGARTLAASTETTAAGGGPTSGASDSLALDASRRPSTGGAGGRTAVAATAGNRAPVYPPEAQRNGWEGVVRVRVRVGADGSCLSATIEESSGVPLLDRAALDAVARWRFHPATAEGDPIEADVVVPIRFSLRSLAR